MKTDPNPRNEPLPVSDWLPIEQAPRDGTWVEGRWGMMEDAEPTRFRDGKWWCLRAERHVEIEVPEPTHFRPLHPTPEAGETRETPETDGQIVYWKRKMYQPSEAVVPADFARRLERERDEARASVVELQQYCDTHFAALREIGTVLDIPPHALPMQLPRFIGDAVTSLRDDLTACRKQLQTATEVVNTLQGICEGYEQRLKVSEPALTASRAEAEGLRREVEKAMAVFPIGFYADESLSSRVRIMRKHWEEEGRVIEENTSLHTQLKVERALREDYATELAALKQAKGTQL